MTRLNNTAGLLLPLWLSVLAVTASCTTAPPKNQDNLCEIFREKGGWYEDAEDASERWGTSVPVLMAIMHQESRFQSDVRPPRKWYLGFIPGPRPSSAYGYSQALEMTWDHYKSVTGSGGADRDDFDDAVDFIGWYTSRSYQTNDIKKDDAYHLYLSYHEGHNGFNKRTFRAKPWLKSVAKKVSVKSASYRRQYDSCKEDLDDGWWFF